MTSPAKCGMICMLMHISAREALKVVAVKQNSANAEELFQILAHPVRLRLLVELSREEECVCHLAALLERPQPYISQQLAELRQAGLVSDRREGQRVFYRLIDERVPSVLLAAGVRLDERRRRMELCACPKCG